MATFDELVNQIDSNLDKQRDRGTAFEKMVVAYLKNEPTYKQKFSDVWMLGEVPEEYGIPKRDLGVDIVARDFAGNLTAVQAKYYKGKVGKDTINSFVAEMGKDYYSAGMLVSSTDEWNRNAEAALQNNTKPITRIGLSQLRRAHFDWQKFSFAKENKLTNKKEKKLRYYQKDAINNSLKYFKTHDRGKLIMAPGTGKTFTSLKIAEALMKDQGKTKFNVLYLVPSIQLLSQTLFNWNNDKADDIHMTSFSVVSDRKANKKKNSSDDDLGAEDIGAEPTTNVEELMDNYKSSALYNFGQEMTVVFSTYQSIDVLHKAQEAGYPEFDLIIADEAFAYAYALLNSADYQQRYANDLRKDLARIPIIKNVDKYVAIGQQLINLHLNYEEVPVYDDVDIQYKGEPSYKVTKMRFAKKRNSETGKLENDRSTIIFNDSITVSNIPEKAYEYIVNGRSAIEWIMDQYRVKTDNKSGITDDPNDYSEDPKYIFNLLLRIINVSVQTVDLINQLPKFEVDESYYKDKG